MGKTERGCGSETISKDGAARTSRIEVRVSETEKTYVQELAEEHGMSVSELVLDCLLGDMPSTREELDREEESLGIIR